MPDVLHSSGEDSVTSHLLWKDANYTQDKHGCRIRMEATDN